jgi:hypothetical protein
VALFGARGRIGLESREDERRTGAMDDRYVSGSSETAGRNRYPLIFVSQGESSPMLKPLMFSLSLAAAFGICSVSKAGGYDANCTTCGLASPQGIVASPQAFADPCVSCAPTCAPKCHFSFHLPQIHCPKIHFTCPKIVHNTCYEWVLQKKHNFSFVHGSLSCGDPCGPVGCAPAPVYPTGQGIVPSGQGVAPIYGAPQTGYRGMKPATSIASAPAEMTPAVATGEEAPPAPATATAAQNGGLLLPTPSGN